MCNKKYTYYFQQYEETYEFMIYKNSKKSNPYTLLINLIDKINFIKVIHMLLYQILACTLHGKYDKVI